MKIWEIKRGLLSWKAQINILEQIQEHWYIQNEQKEEGKEKIEDSIKKYNENCGEVISYKLHKEEIDKLLKNKDWKAKYI